MSNSQCLKELSENKTFKLEPCHWDSNFLLLKGEWLKRSEDVMSFPSVLLLSQTCLNSDPLTLSWTRLLHVQYKLYPSYPLLKPTTLLPPKTSTTYCWGKLCSCMFRYKQGNKYHWSIRACGAEPRSWCLSSAQSHREQLEPVLCCTTEHFHNSTLQELLPSFRFKQKQY